MRNLIASRFLRFGGVTIFCVLGLNTFSTPVQANPIPDLQEEVLRRGISSEDINNAMRNRVVNPFPESDFPYFEPVNGCSNPLPSYWNTIFESACNNHDICYSTPGNTKNLCDNAMLQEMLEICEYAPNSVDEWHCNVAAETFALFLENYDLYVVRIEEAQEAYSRSQDQQAAYIAAVYNWLNDVSHIICTNSNLVTDIAVNPGDRIIIRASGTIVFGAFAGEGDPWGINGFQFYNYFGDVRHGLLMARIRLPGMRSLDGFVPVGEGWNGGREAILSEPGVLEFLVNDNNPQDNRGEFCIEVINLRVSASQTLLTR